MFRNFYNNAWTSFRTTIFWEYGKCETHKDELCRDHVNRRMQNRTSFLSVLRSIYPDGDCDGNVFDTMKFRFFLDNDYCGHYLNKSQNDRLGQASIQVVRRAQATFIENHAVEHLGIPINIVFDELARQGGISCSYDERYLLNYKPGCSIVKVFDNSYWGKLRCEVNPLEAHGFKLKHMHPYTNLDGTLHHYVCDYESPEGEIVSLPLTLWETPDEDFIFDWLHPVDLYPLYNRHNFYQYKRAILVCENEAQVEYIRDKHPLVANRVCLTTWSGGFSITIDGSDWGALVGRQVIIIVGPNREGYKRANKLYRKMKSLGLNEINFLMPFIGLTLNVEHNDESISQRELQDAFDRDLLNSILIKKDVSEPNVFFQDASTRFGLKFKEYNGRAIDLNELLSMELPENTPVLAPIIMAGDKVMIFAHRGSGKTWLICFIVCAIASGMSIFDGMYFAPNPLRVLVFDGEMKLIKLKERYDMVCNSLKVPEHLRSNIRIRASSIEGRPIRLETPEDREAFKDDIEWADIIVVDSVFCLFPKAMGANIDGADGFNEFLISCSLQGKTVIAVDHTGKTKKSSFGTVGKELGLDLMLKLEKPKESDDKFKISFTKGRDLGSNDRQDIRFALNVDKKNGVAELILLSQHYVDHDFDGEEELDEDGEDFSDSVYPVHSLAGDDQIDSFKHDDLDSKIIAALKENPGLSVRALAGKVGISKSTVQTRRKQLEDVGLVVPKPSRTVSVS